MVAASDLNNFTGSQQYVKYSRLFRNHVLSEGAHYIAEQCGAFWLMDAICSYHAKAMKHPMLREMQIWKLKKKGDREAVLTCWKDDGQGEKPLIRQKFELTDFFRKFDGDEITLYVMPSEAENGLILRVVMLPSEY